MTALTVHLYNRNESAVAPEPTAEPKEQEQEISGVVIGGGRGVTRGDVETPPPAVFEIGDLQDVKL